jgi:hypothetical protein
LTQIFLRIQPPAPLLSSPPSLADTIMINPHNIKSSEIPAIPAIPASQQPLPTQNDERLLLSQPIHEPVSLPPLGILSTNHSVLPFPRNINVASAPRPRRANSVVVTHGAGGQKQDYFNLAHRGNVAHQRHEQGVPWQYQPQLQYEPYYQQPSYPHVLQPLSQHTQQIRADSHQ